MTILRLWISLLFTVIICSWMFTSDWFRFTVTYLWCKYIIIGPEVYVATYLSNTSAVWSSHVENRAGWYLKCTRCLTAPECRIVSVTYKATFSFFHSHRHTHTYLKWTSSQFIYSVCYFMVFSALMLLEQQIDKCPFIAILHQWMMNHF